MRIGQFDAHGLTLSLVWEPEQSGPLTRTSPGSAIAEGAVGLRAHHAASDNDTNASFRTESQSFLTRARLKLSGLVPQPKAGPRSVEVNRAFVRDARAQDRQIQVQSDRGGARQQSRAHRLRADDEGRPIRRQADCGLNARGHSIRSFRHQGDQHRGRLRSDVKQRKRLGSPNTGQRQYERERTMGRRATRTNHQGQRMPSLPRQQAVYMTAPETFTTASKQPLTKERRPDMTGIRAGGHASAGSRRRDR